MTKRPTGIETVYRGIRFRSRAEARWAAFFELLGWRWQYEPVDLAGYIPDFVIDFGRPVLFEVKGGIMPADIMVSESILEAVSKIEVSGWTERAIVGGSAPRFDCPTTQLGRFAEMIDGDRYAGDARLFRCGACGEASLNSGCGSWSCIRCDAYDGDRYIGSVDSADELWAEACNVTQWRPYDESRV